MLNLFKTKPPAPAEGWRDPVLMKLHEMERKTAEQITALEAEWERLEARGDFQADQLRERVRAQLPPLYQQRDWLALLITAAEEREAIIGRELMPLFDQRRERLEHRFEVLRVTVDAPSDEAFLAFVRESRELEQLRLTLHEVTGLPEHRREFDAVALLKSRWHDQQQARMRLFDRLLGVGMRHRVSAEEPAWQPTLRRLSELKSCLKGVPTDAR